MSFMDDGDFESANDAEQAAKLNSAIEAVRLRFETGELEEKLRKIGVYVEDHMVMPIPDPRKGVSVTLALRAKVNRVAFTDRVLDPDKHAVDRQFDTMAISIEEDAFLDTRQQIMKNIAEGRDPLDDGDEDA